MFVKRRDLSNFEFAVIGEICDVDILSGGHGLEGHDLDVARSDRQQMVGSTEIGGESNVMNGLWRNMSDRFSMWVGRKRRKK